MCKIDDYRQTLYDNLLVQYAEHQLFLKKIGFERLQSLELSDDSLEELTQKEILHIQMKKDIQALLETQFPNKKKTLLQYLSEIDEDPSPTLSEVAQAYSFDKLLLKLTLLLEFVDEVISPKIKLGNFPHNHLKILAKYYLSEKQYTA